MPRSRRRAALAASIASLLGALASPAAAATHPSLLFDASDVPALRARLDGPLAKVRDAIRAGVDYPFESGDFPKSPDLGYQYFDDRRAIADTVASYAFASLAWAEDGTETGARAKQLGHDYLVGVCQYDDWNFAETQDSAAPDLNLGHFLFSVSLAYDWLYPTLTGAERDLCRAQVQKFGTMMYDAAKLPLSDASSWWVTEYLQNHDWINHAGLGMAALAFDGELAADTKAWLATAQAAEHTVHEVLDLIHGGAWHEGIGYVNYGLDALIPFSLANVRLAGGEDFADNQLARDYPRLRHYAAPPAHAHSREYVVYGDYSGFQDDNTLGILRYVAKKQKDGLAAFTAHRYQDGATQGDDGLTSWPPSQRGMIVSAILYDDAVVETPPAPAGAAWALDHYAADLSLFLARSGWEDADGMLGLKAGVFGGHANFDRLKVNGPPGGSLDFGHDHDDDMGVFFFADGEWLTTTVPAYFIGRDNGSPEGNKTRYANSLLVDGAGQRFEGVRDGVGLDTPGFFDRVSTVSLRGSTSHYAYALAAGGGLYDPALGLETFGRSVLYVDRAIPLIRDVVAGYGAHQYDLVYHAIDDASRDGDWLRLGAKNDRALGVKVLAPAEFAVDYEEQTADHLDKFDPDGSMKAAMIHPTSPTNALTFLTALAPARASAWGAKPSIERVDPAAPERGASITGVFGSADRSDVVMADDPGATASAAGLEVTGMAGVRHVSGGATVRGMLAAGAKLTIDGIPWITIQSGAPSSLELERTASGVAVSGETTSAKLYAPGAVTVTYNGASIPFDVEGDFVIIPKAGGSLGGGGGAGASGGGGGAMNPGAGGAMDTGGRGIAAAEDAATGDPTGACACSAVGGRRSGGAPGGIAGGLAIAAMVGGLARRRRGSLRQLRTVPFALAALTLASPALAGAPSFGVVSVNQKVRPMDAPATASAATLKAAKNELEAFQLVLTAPNGAATGLSVKLSKPLTGPGNAAIPAGNVTLYRAAYYDVGTPSNSEGAPGLWPDPLIPDVDTYFGETRNAFPFDVPAGESRIVWVEILVPVDAIPGDYAGELELDAGGAKVGVVPVALHVGTFALPSTATLASIFGMGWADPSIAHTGDPYCNDPNGSDQTSDALRALYVRGALEHRFTISPIDFQPPFGGSAAPFEATLLPFIQGTGPTRLPGAKVTSVIIDGGNGSLANWVGYAKAKGFFDRLLYYPVDEPGGNASTWATFVAASDALHAVDPSARILITSSIQDADAAGATSNVDVFVPVIDQLENRPGSGQYAGSQRALYDSWLAAQPGRALYSYQSCDEHGCGACGDPSPDPAYAGWPNRVIDSSAVQDRAFPWQAFRLDVSGELYFDTTYQLTNAWSADGQCAFSGSGDGTLFYPGKTSIIGGSNDIPIESIRMKLIREGMEDYEYLTLVAAKDPAKAKAIAEALFPHTYESAQTKEALEQARDQLFALLDAPSSSSSSSSSGSSSGAGGSGAGGGQSSSGAGGANGAGAADAANSDAGPGSGCGCTVPRAPLDAGAVALLLSSAALAALRRRSRRLG